MIARDFVATENKNIQSAIKLAEKNDLRDRPELHYLNARSNGAVWFLLIFIATGSVVYLLFGGDFWLITAWGLLAGSLAGLIAYDYSLRSLSLVRYDSFVHIEWDKQTIETGQAVDVCEDESFYVTLGLHEKIREVVLENKKMSRQVLADNINLGDYYTLYKDWTKVYPDVRKYYLDRGLVKEHGNSTVPVGDIWDWQKWVKTPSPSKQLVS